MILGNGNISDRGETETPAVYLLICDREEEPDPTSTLHSNDDVCLKPQGRQVFEDIKWKTRGQTLRIATWNARTMFQAGKLDNVIQEMDNMNFDVLGLCETRWTGNGNMVHEDHVLIYSGGEEHRNGIGILMKKSVNASLIGFWPISDRVMMATKIKGQPFDINIIQAYAPTSDHSDDETEVFYEEMKQAMIYVKCGEVVIAMGDFNAKVGCGEHLDITGQFGLGSRNERGSRLVQFCE